MQPDRQGDVRQLAEYARSLQQQLFTLRDELSETELTGTAGDGRVTVTLLGTGEVVRVHIDPEVVDPHDVATLEQLLLAAIRDANQAIRTLVERRTRTT